MNRKCLQTLEYPKIIEKLTQFASSSLAKERCRLLLPGHDLYEIQLLQRQTKDGLSRLFKNAAPSFAGVSDIGGSLKRLEIGSCLGSMELLKIADLLETANRVKAYGRREREDIAADSLEDFFLALQPLSPLANEIRRCILAEDEIADEASPALSHIRKSIKHVNDRIHSGLLAYLNGSARSYLQDAVITMRNGRYCIPVKAEHKAQIAGMVHDQSSSGSTVFVEPMSVVKLNNDLRELEGQEAKEIEIILARLSQSAAENSDLLLQNLNLLTELDFIFARSRLAMEQNATEPIFNTKGQIHIRKGRHPLLDPKTVVPIDLTLGKDFDLLIVTGPNTGGKTVSLKTVGLFTLMGQAGLHIPALDRSELALFHEVYADIGDEQSIEQSLSTFSSHMTNIVSFLERADKNSLVLFDELGAGTDPTEGAALAISVLSFLHKQGIPTMATTHYSELKVFALSTAGVENACCEFDVETLRPTYRLLVGIPGKSNAFAISGKLGLPSYIIEDAKKYISEENESFENLIADLQSSRLTIEEEKQKIEDYRRQLEELKAATQKEREKLEERKEKILREANEEARKVLQEAKSYADETIKSFHKLGKASVTAKELEEEREKIRRRLNKVDDKLAKKASPSKTSSLRAKDLHIGDMVKVLSLNLKGTVSTLPDSKGFVFVQMGIMRSRLPISDLQLIDEPVITAPHLKRSGSGKIKMSKSLSLGSEINLLGKTVDEAVAELDKYLDDAYLAHMPSVRIVHGKGTGALRKGVHNYLRRLKTVSSFRLGEFGEGDAGVTIVEFKK